jgi:hypothetical protein
MTVEAELRHRLTVLILLGMLAPYGISAPLFAQFLAAQTRKQGEHAEVPRPSLDLPPIHAGGTHPSLRKASAN